MQACPGTNRYKYRSTDCCFLVFVEFSLDKLAVERCNSGKLRLLNQTVDRQFRM
jgi:hypothetical protein